MTFLGPGTNNIGELYGLGMALRCILASPPVQYSVILTDSDYVHGLLVGNSRVGQNRELVLALKDLLEAVRAIHTVHIMWIKAHAGYHGNEMADQRAKDGQRRTRGTGTLGRWTSSSRSLVPLPIPTPYPKPVKGGTPSSHGSFEKFHFFSLGTSARKRGGATPVPHSEAQRVRGFQDLLLALAMAYGYQLD